MEARQLRNATIVALPFFALISAGVLDAQQPAAPPTPLVRSPGNAEWADSSESARSRAAAEGKFVFYEFDRPKCGTCTRMDALLYPAFEFEALLAQMVPVKLSLESAEGGKLALHFGITDTPAVLVTTPEGRLVFQMSGFSSAEDFYSHIHADLDSYRKFARKVAAQEIGKLGAREAYDTGVALYQRSDPGAALPRLKRAISAPDATASIRDDARELLAAVELDLGQTAASRATIERLLSTTRDSLHRQRGELFRAQLPLAENKPAEALALFRKFLKDHPDSPYRKQVSEMVEKMSAESSRK